MKTISSKIRMFKKPEIKAEEEKIYQNRSRRSHSGLVGLP
jgi:hypothetical protein